MPVDAVFPLGKGSKHDNFELRYALRALEKNFLDLGRVFIVGQCPAWLTNVVHIDMPDSHRHNKDANLIDKVLAACRNGVSEKFLRSSDDQMLLKPRHAADMIRCHYGNLMRRGISRQKAFRGWAKRLIRTAKVLHDRGLPAFHFDTHCPSICDRDLFLRVMPTFDYARGVGLCINTLYANHEPGAAVSPHLNGEKLTLQKAVHDTERLRAALKQRTYLGYTDSGLTQELKQALQDLFPEPSRFETTGTPNIERIRTPAMPLPMVVAVAGPARSGSSCIAGIIHFLGVAMGEHMLKPNRANPKGFFEDRGLRKICKRRQKGLSSPECVRMLIDWAQNRCRGRDVIGGKFGELCNMVPEMASAWPRLKIIVPERDPAESLQSLQRVRMKRRWSTERKMAWNVDRCAKRDIDLAALGIVPLRLPYHEVLADPRAAVRKIIDFLAIAPTDAQIEKAVAFVSPELAHFGSGHSPLTTSH